MLFGGRASSAEKRRILPSSTPIQEVVKGFNKLFSDVLGEKKILLGEQDLPDKSKIIIVTINLKYAHMTEFELQHLFPDDQDNVSTQLDREQNKDAIKRFRLRSKDGFEALSKKIKNSDRIDDLKNSIQTLFDEETAPRKTGFCKCC